MYGEEGNLWGRGEKGKKLGDEGNSGSIKNLIYGERGKKGEKKGKKKKIGKNEEGK